VPGEDQFRRPGLGGARLIGRDDLLTRLGRAAEGKVAIVSAPVGSGKSSPLRAWAGWVSRPDRLAVVQMNRDQRDAWDFWLALLGAVRRAEGTAAGARPSAAAPRFSAPAMADRIVSELAAADGDITLVIDDLHELSPPEALVGSSGLLANLPPRAHAVLATHRDLPLSLHQLRLAGEVAEIRAAERRSAPTHGVARKLKTTTHDNRGMENHVCPRQRGDSRRNG